MTTPIRLIAVDIDGTLLNPQFQVPAANIEALRRAHERGVEVILVTGRRHKFALPVAAELGFDLWLISSNGAVTKSSRGEPFHRDLLPVETARRLCRHMLDFRGSTVLTFDVEGKGEVVLERTDEMVPSIQRWLEKNQEYIDYVVPLEKSLVADPVQAMFCGSVERMRQAQQRLAEGGFEGQITVLRTEYVARDLCIVDILNQGCSKGHALERWATRRGLDRHQVMAIGDNYNDIEMLTYAGTGVIMGNAADELKQGGWAVTASNAEAGVAAAVERFVGV
ncbi:MAG TPA: Cof-type HAD-IIB family hydrolase [Terriglobales bacterium]|nr:Cof-type HAD-IIB family hydrolase [Terriglobales bacterium]